MAELMYFMFLTEETEHGFVKYAYYCKAVLPMNARAKMEQAWKAIGKTKPPEDVFLTRSHHQKPDDLVVINYESRTIKGKEALDNFILLKKWRKG